MSSRDAGSDAPATTSSAKSGNSCAAVATPPPSAASDNPPSLPSNRVRESTSRSRLLEALLESDEREGSGVCVDEHPIDAVIREVVALHRDDKPGDDADEPGGDDEGGDDVTAAKCGDGQLRIPQTACVETDSACISTSNTSSTCSVSGEGTRGINNTEEESGVDVVASVESAPKEKVEAKGTPLGDGTSTTQCTKSEEQAVMKSNNSVEPPSPSKSPPVTAAALPPRPKHQVPTRPVPAPPNKNRNSMAMPRPVQPPPTPPSSASVSALSSGAPQKLQSASDTEYQNLLEIARTQDFSEMEKLGFLYQSGLDKESRPVVVIIGSKLPAKKFPLHEILLFCIRTMDSIVSSEFVVVYIHTNMSPDNYPTFSWLKKVYTLFNRKYKKNLKLLYIVDATSWLKMIFSLFRPFVSQKFWKKLTYVKSLAVLSEMLPVSLTVPPSVLVSTDSNRKPIFGAPLEYAVLEARARADALHFSSSTPTKPLSTVSTSTTTQSSNTTTPTTAPSHTNVDSATSSLPTPAKPASTPPTPPPSAPPPHPPGELSPTSSPPHPPKVSAPNQVLPDLPLIVSDCLTYLREKGLTVQGILRLSPTHSELEALKRAYNNRVSAPLATMTTDPHTVASLLKYYLRELPEPTIPSSMFEDWINLNPMEPGPKKWEAIRTLTSKLPEDHQVLLHAVLKLAVDIQKESEVNLMTTENIAIVLGPCLMWRPREPLAPGERPPADVTLQERLKALSDVASSNTTVQTLISNYSTIFS
ncbi:Rho GTPase-activating protein 8 [Pelomyxa schiedti]|nr:Rho GTPase-activating protein 8 [Pelomyxa schiedti]